MAKPKLTSAKVPVPAAQAGLYPHASSVEEFRFSLPVGVGAILAASASLLTCYAGILSGYIFGTTAFSINPHLQAVLMWGFAIVAVAFFWRDRKRHRSNMPLAVGAGAASILIVTLYLGYDERVEALAYILLVVGALLNQILLLNTLNRQVRHQAVEIDALNRNLTKTVKQQETEIDRLGRLKQFLAPQVAELVVAEGNDALLDTHRRYIACLFCDIRNFTSISEAVEPEDVISILQEFHDRIGTLVSEHGGTIGYRSGDGLMVFFNDPIPCDTPVEEAVRLAESIRSDFVKISAPWTALGHTIGLGIGIASGYATLGLVGFHGRSDYTAIGGVVNKASRLCDMAEDRQILINRRAYHDIEDQINVEELGSVQLKGMNRAEEIYLFDRFTDQIEN